MSANPSGNSDNNNNTSGGSSSKGSGRKRKELSPDRAKDQAKRSYKERNGEGAGRSERPRTTGERTDQKRGNRDEQRSGGSSERPFNKNRDNAGDARPPREHNERPNRKGREEGESARSYNKRADHSAGRREDGRPPRDQSERANNSREEGGNKRSYNKSGKPFEHRENGDDGGSYEKRGRKPYDRTGGSEDRKPYGKAEDRKAFPRRENDDTKPNYGRSEDKKPYNREAKEGSSDRPFKKYVPFEDRKDKRTHLEGDSERKPYQDRKRDNNEPRGKRPEPREGAPQAGGKKFGEKPISNNKNAFENEDFYEDERPFTRSTKWNEQAKAGSMTLNKYLAHSGISSRREAAEIVKSGVIKVNGEVVLEPGYRVKAGDKVTHNDKEMQPQEKLVYILLNKPKDYITTTDDEKGRKKVMDLVASAGTERLYPIGRLDRQTTGVLLITNDGDLAQKLSHPSYNSKKIYQVTLDRYLTKADFEKIIAGVKLEDGIAPVDALAYLEKKNEIGIEIHTGRNRIVRRIFEGLGYVVEKLDRVVYAGLTKKNVGRGKWRFLTEKEIINLKHFKG